MEENNNQTTEQPTYTDETYAMQLNHDVTTSEAPVEQAAPEPTEEQKVAAGCIQFLRQAIPAARIQTNSELLSGREVRRVLIALLETPLENEDRKFVTEQGARLFNLGAQIMAAKYNLFNTAGSVLTEAEKQMVETETVQEMETQEKEQE